jgi:hypothetical protein
VNFTPFSFTSFAPVALIAFATPLCSYNILIIFLNCLWRILHSLTGYWLFGIVDTITTALFWLCRPQFGIIKHFLTAVAAEVVKVSLSILKCPTARKNRIGHCVTFFEKVWRLELLLNIIFLFTVRRLFSWFFAFSLNVLHLYIFDNCLSCAACDNVIGRRWDSRWSVLVCLNLVKSHWDGALRLIDVRLFFKHYVRHLQVFLQWVRRRRWWTIFSGAIISEVIEHSIQVVCVCLAGSILWSSSLVIYVFLHVFHLSMRVWFIRFQSWKWRWRILFTVKCWHCWYWWSLFVWCHFVSQALVFGHRGR